jgi:two-component system cell cycle sensor histidine kinase/response regulator CckA
MPVQLNLTDREKDQIKEIIDLLSKSQFELIEKINKTLLSMAFDNRFTLHPRRLRELGSEEVESLRAFLLSLDTEAVMEFGKERALEGLGEKPLLSLGSDLRQFFSEKIKAQDGELFHTAIKAIDIYLSAYLRGYMVSCEEQTLKDQEQLRKALSTALDKQRRELFIKNHAIHTYINGIMLTDLDGNITYVNPAFLKMWLYDNDEEVLHIKGTQYWGNTDFSVIMSALKNTGGWQSEFVANRKDGSSFDLVVSASLIRDDTGQTVGIMASFIDVTEKNRLEAQFRQAQKMEALGELAGGIIHDFNNLLQVISGYTQLELMNSSEESDRYSNLMQIKVAADRGKGLTEQLRLFTRQDRARRQPLNLNDVVNETYNLLKRTFQPEITIRLKLDPHLKTIEADPSQMSQILMNLCVNARDAMVTGTSNNRKEQYDGTYDAILTLETFNFDLSREQASKFLNVKPGQYVCVRVRDTGIGMPPDLIERLFEPFFTTKSEKSGIGLGLAVVYGIVRNHNGFFDVNSKLGKGSSFMIYLPVLEDEVEEFVSGELEASLTYGKGAILVVDDETQVRELAVQILKKCGYNILLAQNGEEALSLYETRRDEIDLVILDVIMPKMGGRECFYQLKGINPDIKVLIMTGQTTDGSVEDFIKEGAEGVIIKPFDLEVFTDSVNKALSI